MYRSLFVILCLVVCMSMVVAQAPSSGRLAPNPGGQQFSPAVPVLSREQLDRLRPIAQAILERQRARAQGVGPIAADHSPVPSGLTPSLDFSPTFCFFNCKPSSVVPPRPIFSESPIQGDIGGIDLKGFNGMTLWDPAEFDRLMSKPIKLDLNIDLNVEELNRIFLPKQPPIPRLADHELKRSQSASAASASSTRSRPFWDIPNSKVKKLPCHEQCYIFYARCNAGPANGGTGPKGGRKNPNACEEGLRACKAYGCD